MLVVWVYVALASYNTGSLTLELRSLEAVVDEAANIAVVDDAGRIVRSDRFAANANKSGGGEERKGRGGKTGGSSRASGGVMPVDEQPRELDWRNLWNEGTDAVMDVPIGGVCEVLYGHAREDIGEEEAV